MSQQHALAHGIDDLKLEHNEDFAHAFDLMENTTKNLFITGRAGTGKSTLLNHFRNTTEKEVAVVAPTGRCRPQCKGSNHPLFFSSQAALCGSH